VLRVCQGRATATARPVCHRAGTHVVPGLCSLCVLVAAGVPQRTRTQRKPLLLLLLLLLVVAQPVCVPGVLCATIARRRC
jgi:hypothetical protein